MRTADHLFPRGVLRTMPISGVGLGLIGGAVIRHGTVAVA